MLRAALISTLIALTLPDAAMAQSNLRPGPSAALQAAPQPSRTGTCYIQLLAVLPNRVHVVCSTVNGSEFSGLYLAMPTGPNATTFLALATTARQGNMPLNVTATAPEQNPPGCNVSDCRGVINAWLVY